MKLILTSMRGELSFREAREKVETTDVTYDEVARNRRLKHSQILVWQKEGTQPTTGARWKVNTCKKLVKKDFTFI